MAPSNRLALTEAGAVREFSASSFTQQTQPDQLQRQMHQVRHNAIPAQHALDLTEHGLAPEQGPAHGLNF